MADTPAKSPVVPPSSKVLIESGVLEVGHGYDISVRIGALDLKRSMDKKLAAMTAAAALVQRLAPDFGGLEAVLDMIRIFPPDIGTL